MCMNEWRLPLLCNFYLMKKSRSWGVHVFVPCYEDRFVSFCLALLYLVYSRNARKQVIKSIIPSSNPFLPISDLILSSQTPAKAGSQSLPLFPAKRRSNSSSLSSTLTPFHTSLPSASCPRTGMPTCSIAKLALTLPHLAASSSLFPLDNATANPPKNALPPPVGSITLLDSL